MAPITPPLAKEQKMKAASFYKYILGRTCILANLVLVLVGLGQLQVPLFFRTSLELYNFLQNGPNYPTIGQRTENEGSILL
jgi:hypothetical protein